MSESSDKSGAIGSLVEALPTEKLTEIAQTLLKALAGKAVDAAVGRVDGLAGKLTGVAADGGAGLGSALSGGLGGAASAMTSGVGDKVKGALGMGGGDGGGGDGDGGDAAGSNGSGGDGASGKFKFMNITESMDVGVPVRMAYDQWTQFADFPSFMKKVESVEQESDEKTNWKAQVMWSHRTWEATTLEQIPDSHIIWRSTGAKGHADGMISFHELGPELTRILLVLEYYPQGFVEKTGNLWRAVGRRTRLEFKHFCRHLVMETLLTPEEDRMGWRGEIRDSEVVKTHEEAIEEERAAAESDDLDGEDVEDTEDVEDVEDVEDAEDEGPATDSEIDRDPRNVDGRAPDASAGEAHRGDGNRDRSTPEDEAPRRSRQSKAGNGSRRRASQPSLA